MSWRCQEIFSLVSIFYYITNLYPTDKRNRRKEKEKSVLRTILWSFLAIHSHSVQVGFEIRACLPINFSERNIFRKIMRNDGGLGK